MESTGIYIKDSSDVNLIDTKVSGFRNGVVVEGSERINSFGNKIETTSSPVQKTLLTDSLVDLGVAVIAGIILVILSATIKKTKWWKKYSTD